MKFVCLNNAFPLTIIGLPVSFIFHPTVQTPKRLGFAHFRNHNKAHHLQTAPTSSVWSRKSALCNIKLHTNEPLPPPTTKAPHKALSVCACVCVGARNLISCQNLKLPGPSWCRFGVEEGEMHQSFGLVRFLG